MTGAGTMADLTPTTKVTTAGGTPTCRRWGDSTSAVDAAWAIDAGGEDLILELESDPEAILL